MRRSVNAQIRETAGLHLLLESEGENSGALLSCFDFGAGVKSCRLI
jgi:hypothetical protein